MVAPVFWFCRNIIIRNLNTSFHAHTVYDSWYCSMSGYFQRHEQLRCRLWDAFLECRCMWKFPEHVKVAGALQGPNLDISLDHAHAISQQNHVNICIYNCNLQHWPKNKDNTYFTNLTIIGYVDTPNHSLIHVGGKHKVYIMASQLLKQNNRDFVSCYCKQITLNAYIYLYIV